MKKGFDWEEFFVALAVVLLLALWGVAVIHNPSGARP